jgi:hypothetical protein
VLGRTKRFLPDGSSVWNEAFSADQSVTLSVLPRQGLYVDVSSRSLPIANELYSGQSAVRRIVHLHSAGDRPGHAANDARGGRWRADFNPAEVIDAAVAADGEMEVVGRASRPRDHRGGAGGRRSADGEAGAQRRCERIWSDFAARHVGEVPPEQDRLITTFEDRNAVFIGAVRNEIVLVMFIFGIVSMTAAFLVLAIFWAMISEKTRDIGILRAIGASRLGIAWLWLRYGLANRRDRIDPRWAAGRADRAQHQSPSTIG